MPPATTWVAQAQSFLGFAARTFGVWAAHPAMAGARQVNDAVNGPTGLAKVSAQVAASVLRHSWNAYEARADKEDPQWSTWLTAWKAARDKVGGQKASVVLDKEATWGNAGALLVMAMAALKLEATKASPIIVPSPNPARDHAWLREFMRTQTPPTAEVPAIRPESSPEAEAKPTPDEGGGILPLLLLFLL